MKSLSIDETELCGDVYTILSNKAGKGKKETVIVIVRGTKAEVVSRIIMKILENELAKVKEITMDFRDSMYSIARGAFLMPTSLSTASISYSVCVKDLKRCA